VAVVGPSGAGKDTLIGHARIRLEGTPGVLFVRRCVTRPCAGGADAPEDHDTLDEPAFRQAARSGAFALTWAAHGLLYGLPASLDDTIRAGGVAVANVSRAALPGLRARYARPIVVHVTAPLALRAGRLAARGRETAAEVAARLSRSVEEGLDGEVVEIVNDRDVASAGDALAQTIRAALAAPPLHSVIPEAEQRLSGTHTGEPP